MLRAIDKSNEIEPSSEPYNNENHKKNAFSFMNEKTDIQQMLRPNVSNYDQ